MGAVNLLLWIGGVALIALGYSRARGSWRRYQTLKEEDANAERYAAWRGGGVRDTGPTGASVAMAMLRREAQTAGLIAIAGVVLVFLGFLLK